MSSEYYTQKQSGDAFRQRLRRDENAPGRLVAVSAFPSALSIMAMAVNQRQITATSAPKFICRALCAAKVKSLDRVIKFAVPALCALQINVPLNTSPIFIYSGRNNLFLWREKQSIYSWRVKLMLLSVMNLVAIWSVEKHICNCNLQASSERNYQFFVSKISVAHTQVSTKYFLQRINRIAHMHIQLFASAFKLWNCYIK